MESRGVGDWLYIRSEIVNLPTAFFLSIEALLKTCKVSIEALNSNASNKTL